MTLQRPEEAEAEPKRDRIIVRMGDQAKQAIRAAARWRGVSMTRYMRDAALERAIADRSEFGQEPLGETG